MKKDSKPLNQNRPIITESDLELLSILEWEIPHESLGHVNEPLSSSANVKTSSALSLHLSENDRKLLSYNNFIRNHKINITFLSYSFVRNKVKVWESTC